MISLVTVYCNERDGGLLELDISETTLLTTLRLQEIRSSIKRVNNEANNDENAMGCFHNECNIRVKWPYKLHIAARKAKLPSEKFAVRRIIIGKNILKNI